MADRTTYPRAAAALVLLALAALLAFPASAHASTVYVDNTADPSATAGVTVPDTNVYITNTTSANCVFSSLSNVTYGAGGDGLTGLYVNSGKTSGSFTATWANAGYTVQGQPVDLVVNGAVALGSSKGQKDVFFMKSCFCSGAQGGVAITFAFHIRLHGQSSDLPGASFFFRQRDIDANRNKGGYTEGVTFTSGWNAVKWAGKAQGSSHPVLNQSGNRYYASHGCGARNCSSVSCVGTTGAVLVWTGYSSRMGGTLGISSSMQYYPTGPLTFSKALASSAVTPTSSGGSAAKVTWQMTSFLPDVAPSNQAGDIKVEDKLPAFLDADKATVSVTRAGADATSNWAVSRSGANNTVTLTAKSTAHGAAAGAAHVFTVTAPVKALHDFSADGAAFTESHDLRYVNTATLSISPNGQLPDEGDDEDAEDLELAGTAMYTVHVGDAAFALDVAPADGAPPGLSMSYVSGDPSVASVDGSGNVTPMGVGTTEVTVAAEAPGYSPDAFTVTVVVAEAEAGDGDGEDGYGGWEGLSADALSGAADAFAGALLPQRAWAAAAGPVITRTATASVDVRGYVSPDSLVQKLDAQLMRGLAQGDATLEGARFQVRYWAAWSAEGEPDAVATLSADASGAVSIAGDGDWPVELDGHRCIPWGTFTVTEVGAPSGYLLNRNFLYAGRVRFDDSSNQVVATPV